MTGVRLRSGLATAVLLPLIAAGCAADKEEPPPFEAGEGSTSPSASKQPWEEKTEAGRRAFIKYWFDTLTTAMNTGETDVLADLGTKNCYGCTGSVRGIKKFYRNGGSLEAGDYNPQKISRLPKEGKLQPYLVSLSRKSEIWTAPNGQQTKWPGGFTEYSMKLIWKEGQWKIDDYYLLDS